MFHHNRNVFFSYSSMPLSGWILQGSCAIVTVHAQIDHMVTICTLNLHCHCTSSSGARITEVWIIEIGLYCMCQCWKDVVCKDGQQKLIIVCTPRKWKNFDGAGSPIVKVKSGSTTKKPDSKTFI